MSRWGVCDDLSLVHHDDAVGGVCLILKMRRHDDGRGVIVDPLSKIFEKVKASGRVESGRGLVQKKERWIMKNGAAEIDSSFHSPREMSNRCVGFTAESTLFQEAGDEGDSLGSRNATKRSVVHEILTDAHRWIQRRGLKNDTGRSSPSDQ